MMLGEALHEYRARRWWRRQLCRPLADRVSERDRETIESRFAYGHPDPERADLATKLQREIRADDPGWRR